MAPSAHQLTAVSGSLRATGGNGGFIETSGLADLAVDRAADASAAKGRAGTWLLDPQNITIAASDSNVSGAPGYTSTGNSAVINASNISATLNAGTNVTVTTVSAGSQAGDISVTGGISAITIVASSTGGTFDVTLNANLAGTGGSTSVNSSVAPIADRTIWSDLRQARQAARNETPTPAPPPVRVEGNPGYAIQGASTAILIAVPQAVAATVSVAQVTTGYGFLSPQGTGANYFRVLPVAELSVDALTNLLQSRTAYKKELFSDAIAQLVRNPDMADVPSCADGAGGLAGTCLLQPEGREADQAMQATAVDRTRIEERAAPRPARRIAVLFGLDQYQDKRIPQLTNAVSDASAVGAALARKMGFETRVLSNATKAEVIAQLNRLVEETAASDSVVVYFAGHGEMVEKTGLGYWIPSDADAARPQGWISNTDVSRALSRARSKQIAVFADSCYSGVFASEASMSQSVESASVEDLQRRRAVTVMSSGGDEPVADGGKAGHSVFAWNLLQQIDELQGWAPGAQVFDAVRKGVERELPQSPVYGASLAAGHEPGGDFLFEGRAAGPRKTSY